MKVIITFMILIWFLIAMIILYLGMIQLTDEDFDSEMESED